MEKIATEAFTSPLSAAYSAMFTAKVVLPIEGRPATTTRSPGRSPPVLRSNSSKPVGRPRRPFGLLCHSSIWSMSAGISDCTESAPSRLPPAPCSAMAKTLDSAISTRSRAVSPSLLNTEAAMSAPACSSWRKSERSRTMEA